MAYRQAVARAYDQCGSSTEVSVAFGCSASWVRRLMQQGRERGTLEPRSTARHTDLRRYDEADERAIRELIRTRPDATLAEVARALGTPAGMMTVSRTLKRLNLPRKKSRRMPANRAAPTWRQSGRAGSPGSPGCGSTNWSASTSSGLRWFRHGGEPTAGPRRASGSSRGCRTGTGRRSAPSPR